MNIARNRLAEGKLVLCMALRQARTVDIAPMVAASGFESL